MRNFNKRLSLGAKNGAHGNQAFLAEEVPMVTCHMTCCSHRVTGSTSM